jgi:hypothetical protein
MLYFILKSNHSICNIFLKNRFKKKQMLNGFIFKKRENEKIKKE